MTSFSYQMYSSRNFPSRPATLAMLKDAGYAAVEGFGGLYPDRDALAALATDLDAAGLAMTSGHFGLDMVENDPDLVIDIAKRVGMKSVYVPFIMPDDRPTDAAGWKAFGETLQRVSAPIRAAGLTFGYHNHDFEFRPLPNGTMPIELILDGGPDVTLELDVAWVVRADRDPLPWISRYAERIDAIHVKDIAPAGEAKDEDGWADVGHGVIDWAALMTASLKTKAQHFVMEHDNPSDEMRFATRSIAAARTY